MQEKIKNKQMKLHQTKKLLHNKNINKRKRSHVEWEKIFINHIYNIGLISELCKELTQPASQMALVIKNPPINAAGIRDAGSTPGSGRFPGERHSNPFQYSSLENPMDRGAWWATLHSVTKNWTD